MPGGNATVWLSAIAVLITFSTLLSSALFRVGHLSARVEALEQWRGSLRNDMHEISDKITGMLTELRELRTLIEERTERRSEPRRIA